MELTIDNSNLMLLWHRDEFSARLDMSHKTGDDSVQAIYTFIPNDTDKDVASYTEDWPIPEGYANQPSVVLIVSLTTTLMANFYNRGIVTEEEVMEYVEKSSAAVMPPE